MKKGKASPVRNEVSIIDPCRYTDLGHNGDLIPLVSGPAMGGWK